MAQKLLLLHCAEGAKKALDKMVETGGTIPEVFRTYEVPCTGRVNDVMLMEALQDGYDGVLVVACYKDNCKYLDGNKRAEKRVGRVKNILIDSGINNRFIDITFVSPDEGRKLENDINTFQMKMNQEAGKA